MKVIAPGKLILSGEHAVVYGQPALAMAVNRYVTAKTTATPLPIITFNLMDFAYQRRFHLSALHLLKNRIKNKYKRFINGEFKIREVLQKPVELAQLAFSLFFDSLNIKLTQGIHIHLESTIPIGCGMGSSAATVLSIVHAIAEHLSIPLSKEKAFDLGLEAENMQHGFSSGLDLRVSLNGGCVYLHENILHTRAAPVMPLYLVNTGSPETSTGTCVESVRKFFKSSSIGQDFGDVTRAMDYALQTNHSETIIPVVRSNHQLLNTLGVVPNKVSKFISEIEQLGGAAKICGAGAVAGDKAGMVLVITDDPEMLMKLCSHYQYTLMPIKCEAQGVYSHS